MRAITVSTDSDQLRRVLRRVSRRLEDLTPALERIGGVVRASVTRNHETRTVRDVRGAAGPILRRTTGLKSLAGSIAVTVGSRSVTVSTDPAGAHKDGFAMARVPAHQQESRAGRPAQVKAHTRRMRVPWGDIPVRPFVTLTPEDRAAIMTTLQEHIVKDTP